LNALQHYHGPVLIIGGALDRSTPPEESRAMFAAVQGRKKLWIVPTGDHAEICDLTDTLYRANVATFLAKTIGRPLT